MNEQSTPRALTLVSAYKREKYATCFDKNKHEGLKTLSLIQQISQSPDASLNPMLMITPQTSNTKINLNDVLQI